MVSSTSTFLLSGKGKRGETNVPSMGCPGASRCTKGASCADVHVIFSGGVIMDRILGSVLEEAPSLENSSAERILEEKPLLEDSSVDQTSGCVLVEVPSPEDSWLGAWDKRSSECGVEERETALTTHWREGRAGKSCNRSLMVKLFSHSYKKIDRSETYLLVLIYS